ncbi:hypothetical protein [Castellaniella sp.]|uniref:hypothetical protein n=1 Tax=Castellaniella sp. TaxID=1955812 RepID=UPI002AFE25E7|nr:hypothetical protein [Castellaniella sp.]
MPRPIPLFTRLLSISLLGLLGACAQQAGYYDTPRESTASDAMHRAQGGGTAIAPSQLQLGFGGQTEAKPATGTPEDAGNAIPVAVALGQTAATTGANRQGLPQSLADTRTYLGTVACTGAAPCSASRLTLTLAPDGQWRARNTPADGSSPASTAMGCWFLTHTDPVRIVLQAGEQPYASLELVQSNVLKLLRLNGQAPVLESRLTRQADLDPITELSSQPAQACPAA